MQTNFDAVAKRGTDYVQAAENKGSVLDALSREAQVLAVGTGVGFAKATQDAVEHPAETGLKVALATSIAGVFGYLSHGRTFGLGPALAKIGSTALGIAFVSDVLSTNRVSSIQGALAEAWQGDGNLQANTKAIEESLGQLAFDTTLLTGTGLLTARFGQPALESLRHNARQTGEMLQSAMPGNQLQLTTEYGAMRFSPSVALETEVASVQPVKTTFRHEPPPVLQQEAAMAHVHEKLLAAGPKSFPQSSRIEVPGLLQIEMESQTAARARIPGAALERRGDQLTTSLEDGTIITDKYDAKGWLKSRVVDFGQEGRIEQIYSYGRHYWGPKSPNIDERIITPEIEWPSGRSIHILNKAEHENVFYVGAKNNRIRYSTRTGTYFKSKDEPFDHHGVRLEFPGGRSTPLMTTEGGLRVDTLNARQIITMPSGRKITLDHYERGTMEIVQPDGQQVKFSFGQIQTVAKDGTTASINANGKFEVRRPDGRVDQGTFGDKNHRSVYKSYVAEAGEASGIKHSVDQEKGTGTVDLRDGSTAIETFGEPSILHPYQWSSRKVAFKDGSAVTETSLGVHTYESTKGDLVTYRPDGSIEWKPIFPQPRRSFADWLMRRPAPPHSNPTLEFNSAGELTYAQAKVEGTIGRNVNQMKIADHGSVVFDKANQSATITTADGWVFRQEPNGQMVTVKVG